MEIRDIGSSRGDAIVVGKVVKAHGIKGEIKVYPYSGHPEDFAGYRRLTLSDPRLDRHLSFKVLLSRSMGNLALLRLAELDDRDGAEALRDWEVSVEKDMLPELAQGIYYWHVLDGMPVLTEEGEELGNIKGRMATGGQDILVVDGRKGEYLIPAVSEIVIGISPDGSALLVSPPPGLLELNR